MSMGKVNENKEIHLKLLVDSADYEVMEKAASDRKLETLNFLQKAINNYITSRAGGGLMLTVNDLDRIRKTTGAVINVPADVVTAAEKGVGMKDGKKGFTVDIDPSLLSHATEMAGSMGITVQEFVEQCWSFVLANGWLHEINPEAHWIPFSPSHIRRLKDAVGENINSDTIVAGLKKK